MSLWDDFISLFRPPTCDGCGEIREGFQNPYQGLICDTCLQNICRIPFNDNPESTLAKLFIPTVPFENAIAMGYYQPKSTLRQLILHLKYRRKPRIGQQLGRQFAIENQYLPWFLTVDAIVPLPLLPMRQKKRGYNQSLAIAQGMAAVLDIPIFDGYVKRDEGPIQNQKSTSQTTKKRVQRMLSVNGQFYLAKTFPANVKHILLVDDVVTTGSTLAACYKALASHGEIKVSAAALGFTPLKN